MNEKELFEFLKGLDDSLVMMKQKYSRHDCVSEKHKSVIELKCRKKHYDTMLIEKKKYDALVAKAEALGYTPYYINSTPEGIYSWNLNDIEINWKIENKHPATTSFGNRMRVEKEVGYLDIAYAKVLK